MKNIRVLFGFLWLIALTLIIFVSIIRGFREIHFLCFLENWIPFADKAAHLVTYMFMAFTATLFFKDSKLIIYSLLGLFLLGIALEIIQLNVAGRNFSFLDLAANIIGVIIGFSMAWFVMSHFRGKNSSGTKKSC